MIPNIATWAESSVHIVRPARAAWPIAQGIAQASLLSASPSHPAQLQTLALALAASWGSSVMLLQAPACAAAAAAAAGTAGTACCGLKLQCALPVPVGRPLVCYSVQRDAH